MAHHYCKCGAELKLQSSSCVKCGGAAEARVGESNAEIGIAVARHPVPAPREPAHVRETSDWLGASSAGLRDEQAIILPITSEPDDGDLDEEIEDQFPQYVPVPPPIWDDPPISAEERQTIIPIEQAILIPIDELLPREPATMEAMDQTPPPEPAEAAFLTYLIRTEPERRRGHLVSSALLLLLASILLFVFAWMTHK